MLACLDAFFAHPFFSVVAGVVAGIAGTWLFYKKAGDELRIEAEKLAKQTDNILTVITFLQTAAGKRIELIRDSSGKVIGVNFVIIPETGILNIKGHAPTVTQTNK